MKTNNNEFEESLDFVTRFYHKGAFQSLPVAERRGWRRLLNARNIAAAAIGVALTASACIYFISTSHPTSDVKPVERSVQTEQLAAQPAIRLEFNDAPLSEVVNEIEEAYGVEIHDVPSTDARLTLSYEGTAEDLVATINSLLDTDMTVTTK